MIDSPTYTKRAAKSSRFAHEIFTNAFTDEKVSLQRNMLPVTENYVKNKENVKFSGYF
jgi:hypothetical protein